MITLALVVGTGYNYRASVQTRLCLRLIGPLPHADVSHYQMSLTLVLHQPQGQTNNFIALVMHAGSRNRAVNAIRKIHHNFLYRLQFKIKQCQSFLG